MLMTMAQWLADHREELVETAVREVSAVRTLARLAQDDMAIDQAYLLSELSPS
ncbi:hypothetical protein [Mycobacterium sp. 852002-51971_SCH5477799-a]|uniref:hypothetical protein n=1 Tax=Mycobacterium sp. 852002-51971_SCH5477799-a TaxID=1834106 RepID=UPI000ADB1AA0|nr:hypothetical protein [Mycobacterium sp. 852002-51971_SCH5477799-a]